MKIKMLLSVLLVVMSTTIVYAQTLKTWKWTSYKMEFKAPTNFKVDENTSKIFDAGNEEIHLTIYPEKGTSMAKKEMKASLRKWARDEKLKFDGAPEEMEDLNGYWGVFIDGTSPDDLPTTVLLLVDPDYPEISFYVWLQYQEEQFNTAVKILKSFLPS